MNNTLFDTLPVHLKILVLIIIVFLAYRQNKDYLKFKRGGQND